MLRLDMERVRRTLLRAVLGLGDRDSGQTSSGGRAEGRKGGRAEGRMSNLLAETRAMLTHKLFIVHRYLTLTEPRSIRTGVGIRTLVLGAVGRRCGLVNIGEGVPANILAG